jgi:hypothetical protein
MPLDGGGALGPRASGVAPNGVENGSGTLLPSGGSVVEAGVGAGANGDALLSANGSLAGSTGLNGSGAPKSLDGMELDGMELDGMELDGMELDDDELDETPATPANGSLVGVRVGVPRPANGSFVGTRPIGAGVDCFADTPPSGGMDGVANPGEGVPNGNVVDDDGAGVPSPANGSFVGGRPSGVNAGGGVADCASPNGSSARGVAAAVACPAKGSPDDDGAPGGGAPNAGAPASVGGRGTLDGEPNGDGDGGDDDEPNGDIGGDDGEDGDDGDGGDDGGVTFAIGIVVVGGRKIPARCGPVPGGPAPPWKGACTAVGCAPPNGDDDGAPGAAPNGGIAVTVVGGADVDGGGNEGGDDDDGGGNGGGNDGDEAMAPEPPDAIMPLAMNTWLHLLQRTRMGPLASLSSPTLNRV